MTENEINTAKTEPESITAGSGNHNSNKGGLRCLSLGLVSRPHVPQCPTCLGHVLILTGACPCLWLHSAVWYFLHIIIPSKMILFPSNCLLFLHGLHCNFIISSIVKLVSVMRVGCTLLVQRQVHCFKFKKAHGVLIAHFGIKERQILLWFCRVVLIWHLSNLLLSLNPLPSPETFWLHLQNTS